MRHPERDLFLSHLWFAAVAIVVLAVPGDVAVGVRIAVLVALYNVAIPVLGITRGHREWLRVFSFVFPLSVLMVVPDWFLSAHLGVLRFPPDGLADIGTVTAYMAGLWTIPLFLAVTVGQIVESRQGRGPAYLAVLLLSALLFLPTEALAAELPMWEAVGVRTVNDVAVYVVPAELLLGVVTYRAYLGVRTRPLIRLPAAVGVMVFYLGAAVTSWFLLEDATLRLVTSGT